MIISVIVITRNNASQLKECLSYILNQNHHEKYEVIVVDNASTDGTFKVVKRLQNQYHNLKYAYQEKKGRGFARNKGLEKVKGDIIAFTDDDCIVEEEWLNKLDKRFEEFPNVSAVGGAICNGTDSKWGWATYFLNFSSWLPSRKFGYVKDIPTANIAYKTYDIKGIQFPEFKMDIDYEDTLFNLELIKKGKKILFDPKIRVNHIFGISSITSFLKKQKQKGKSFKKIGYTAHGALGLFLINNPSILLFCPRIFLVFLRCLKSKRFLIKFTQCFPLLIKGEYTRALTMRNLK